MRKLVVSISLALVSILCAIFLGCAPKVELSSISATGAKTEFAWGEEFSSANIIVSAQYNDGSAKEITDYTIDSSAYDKTEAGTYEIKINYENKQTSYFVTVNAPTLTSITVTNAKTEFGWNETFSAGEIVVKAHYSDNSEVAITDYTIDSSAYVKNVAGTYSINVSYNGQSANYDVVVNAPTLTSITVTNAKIEFDWNETFSAGEIVVKAHYSDNSEVVITDYTIDSSAYVKNVAGTYSITVSYNGQSASYDVTVASAPLRGITVSGAKVEFDWGSQFSHEGLVVKARYADNNIVEVDDYEVDSSAFNSQSAGAYVITVRFENKSATYSVVVKQGKVTGIEITSYKDEYTIYENFDSSSVKGFIVRESGEKEEISQLNSSIELVDYEDLKLGEYSANIKSKENESVTHTLNFNVVKAEKLKVLMIGNSFSDDTAHYVPDILQDLGYEYEVGNMFIGGCSIDSHYSNLTSNSASYDFRYYKDGSWIEKYGNQKQTLENAITFTDWDVITFQQVSGSSGKGYTYDYLPDLIEGVKALSTNQNVKVAFNMTWAYQSDSNHTNFPAYNNNQNTMYEAIVNAVQQRVTIPVIPNGTAIQNVRSSYVGDTLTRDGYHLTYDLGRYIAGLTLVSRLTLEDVSEVEYKPEGVSEEEYIVAIESVINAMNSPFTITQSQYETIPVRYLGFTINGGKREFEWGEEFSASGLEICEQYSDYSEQKVLDYVLDSSDYNKNRAGLYSIKVTHKDQTKTYVVRVNEPKLTGITLSGATTEFDYGADFTADGLVVKAQYSDNTEKEISDYIIDSSAYDKTVAGSYSITVSFEGCVSTYEVTVKEGVLKGVIVSGAKKEFELGEEFSTDGLVVMARYSITYKVEVFDYEVDSSQYNKDVAGSYVITVHYEGKYTTYIVTVNTREITSIEITSYKQTYTLFENFSTSDVTGYVVRGNGNKEPISTENVTFKVVGYEDLKLGAFSVLITSREKTDVTYTLHLETVKAKKLRLLMIGNSFSDDTSHYVPNILSNLGYEYEVGNMYIGGCSIDKHYSNFTSNSASYDFRYYTNGAWNNTYGNQKQTLEYAIKFKDWDVITFQQASGSSGVSSSYSNLSYLINGVKAKATNPNVKVAFNMTWAYQGNSTHSSFPTYGSNQMTMYQAIVNAVQEKVNIPVIPSGTAIQNARSSFVGDTLTRDGYHLTYDFGRYVAGLTLVGRLTFENLSSVSYVPANVSTEYRSVAIESATNAQHSPYAVTKSEYTQVEDVILQGLTPLSYENYGWTTTGGYWNSTTTTYNKCMTYESYPNDVNAPKFVATKRFTKAELPIGSVIKIESGWTYRPEAWTTDSRQSSRPGNVTTTYVVVTSEWWGNYTLRAFNVGKGVVLNSNSEPSFETAKSKLTIYVPKN